MSRRRFYRLSVILVLSLLLLAAISPLAFASDPVEPYSKGEVTGTTLAPPPPPQVSGGSVQAVQESLPETGADSLPWAAIGVGLLVLGAFLVIAARSRKAPAHRH